MRISTSPRFPGYEEFKRLVAERGFDRMQSETKVLLDGVNQVPHKNVMAADDQAGIIIRVRDPDEARETGERYEYLRGKVEIVLPEKEAA